MSDLHPSEIRVNELKQRQLELEIEAAERMAERILASGEHNGKFRLIGAVHEASVHNLMADIDSFVVRNPGAAVEIMVNSGGGSVVDGLALIDYLRLLQARGHHIKIVGVGMVASMSSAILSCANERVLTSRCYLGLHEVSSQASGSISIQEDSIKLAKALQGEVVTLLCERSSLTPAKLKSIWARKDIYFNAAQALKLGLIDHIEEN